MDKVKGDLVKYVEGVENKLFVVRNNLIRMVEEDFVGNNQILYKRSWDLLRLIYIMDDVLGCHYDGFSETGVKKNVDMLLELYELTTKMVKWNIERNGEVMDVEERDEMNRILGLWNALFGYFPR